MVLAPSQLRTPQQPMKEALIQRVEDLFEIVVAPFWTTVALGSALAANLLGLPRHGLAVLESLVAMIVRAVDRLLVDLGDEDMGNRPQHALRRAFEQIGEAHMQFTLTQTDRRIQRDEAPEADAKRRHGRPRSERPVLLLKDRNYVRCRQCRSE